MRYPPPPPSFLEPEKKPKLACVYYGFFHILYLKKLIHLTVRIQRTNSFNKMHITLLVINMINLNKLLK